MGVSKIVVVGFLKGLLNSPGSLHVTYPVSACSSGFFPKVIPSLMEGINLEFCFNLIRENYAIP
jgi:hypothetical protein